VEGDAETPYTASAAEVAGIVRNREGMRMEDIRRYIAKAAWGLLQALGVGFAVGVVCSVIVVGSVLAVAGPSAFQPRPDPEQAMTQCILDHWLEDNQPCWDMCVETYRRGTEDFSTCWRTGWRVTILGVVGNEAQRASTAPKESPL